MSVPTRIVTLYSVTNPTNTILNIETIERPLSTNAIPNPMIPPSSNLDSSNRGPLPGGIGASRNHNRRINRSTGDWQLLIDWINKTFGDLIPPPAPPSRCSDLSLLASSITLILNWIESHERITSSNGWSLFLQGDFHFQPPALPPSHPKSLSSLFFPNKISFSKEVDVKFDQAKEVALDWQSFLSAFGRLNEQIGLTQQNASKSCKETALQLAALQHRLPTMIQRKTTKFFASDSVYLANESAYRLSSLNDQIIMGLQGTQIVINSLDYRRQILTDYEDACQKTQKKLMNMENLRASRWIKQDAVDAALEEMTQIKKVEEETKQKFKEVSDNLRNELQENSIRRDNDLEKILDHYVDRQIEGIRFLVSILQAKYL